jgi:hypothetical protein
MFYSLAKVERTRFGKSGVTELGLKLQGGNWGKHGIETGGLVLL